jgi:glycerol-3-phosphate acyltransferase PlsX
MKPMSRVSAATQGRLMALSMFRLGLIEGNFRPAIAVIWPTIRGQSVVLDVGANAASDARAATRRILL